MRTESTPRSSPPSPRHFFVAGLAAALLSGALTGVVVTQWDVGVIPAGAATGFLMFLLGYWLGNSRGEHKENAREDSQSEC
jgi:hypothetical protein